MSVQRFNNLYLTVKVLDTHVDFLLVDGQPNWVSEHAYGIDYARQIVAAMREQGMQADWAKDNFDASSAWIYTTGADHA